MFSSFPSFSNWPILATANAAVEPVPKPIAELLLTYSTAFQAACCFNSSWLRALTLTVAFLEDRGLLGGIEKDCCSLEGDINTFPMVAGMADRKAFVKVIVYADSSSQAVVWYSPSSAVAD